MSRAFTVKVEIPNRDQRLKPGMFARVKIFPAIHRNAMVVPLASVMKREGRTFVFVVNGDVVRLREVEVGIADEQSVEVTRGLRDGEEIAVSGHYGMADNIRGRVLRD